MENLRPGQAPKDSIRFVVSVNEILISNPELNTDPFREHAFIGPGIFAHNVLVFEDYDLSPEKYPKVCDLSSGDGVLALLLKQKGWKPKNITCIDHCRPNPPLIKGVRWVYMDLRKLCHTLKQNIQLPENVEKFRGKFDIVTHAFSYLRTDEEELVNRFFVRNGGFIFGAGKAPGQRQHQATPIFD